MKDLRLDGPISECPEFIDDGFVLWWAAFNTVGSSPRMLEIDRMGDVCPSRFRTVAIAKYLKPMRAVGYAERDQFYVFFCDADWTTTNDVEANSFEEALAIVHERTAGLKILTQGERKRLEDKLG